MKAYILSSHFGTVQIGNTVFQPCTGNAFRVDSRPWQEKNAQPIDVPDKSMRSAELALSKI